MESNPKVSVIVPIYKAENYLRKCLDSILSQTFSSWECILVDDGSPDRSGEICDEYVAKDSRFKVIHQNNGGVNLARKTGFVNSSGEWITFVDADDTLPSNAIELLISHSEGVELVSGSVSIYRYGSNVSEIFPSHIQEVGQYDGQTFLRQLFEGSRLCSICRQLIKRSILSENLLDISSDVKFSEDFIINLRLGLKVKHCLGIKEIVYNYNYYQGNTATSFQMKREYLDRYYIELLKGISDEDKIIFGKYLYFYLLNKALAHIGVKDINKSNIASYLLSKRKNYQLSFKQQYVLFLLKIPSCILRSTLFRLYNNIAKILLKVKRLCINKL